MLPAVTETVRIETLPDQLQRLADDELVHGLQLAIRGEQRMTLRVLHHLNEVERRRLHLDHGYGSLWDYCVRKLKYSPSAAGRRIQAARCIQRHPQVVAMLQAQELSLSVVALIEPILTEDNCDWILERVRNCSHREVHRIVAEFRPPVAFRDRITPVRVAVPAVDADAFLLEREFASGTPHYARQVTIESQLMIQFVADEELVKQFEEAKALLSQRGNNPSFAEVMKALLAEFLKKHSPIVRHARREAKKGAVGPDSRRRECDELATRCGSSHGLQLDHIVPYSAGGTNDISNLRLLCAAHNRRVAEKLLGVDLMRSFCARE